MSKACELIWVICETNSEPHLWINLSNVCLILSNVCESKFWVTLVGHFWAKKYFNGNIMTVGLYLVEVFYLSLKKYGCRIVLSWTD